LVEVPVYVSFELGSQETINLNNPDSNDVTFKYEVYNGDTMLFSTDTISPGEAETVVLGDYLASGEYELVFNVRCFLNGSEVNGLEEPVTVTIK
jgi:5-hydroxyisourate hydrolase-like protein (transthyretin family)